MGLNKYQKGDFTRAPVDVYQKSIFNFLNHFANTSDYLNFRLILKRLSYFQVYFRQLRKLE